MGQLLANLDTVRSSELYMGPWSSDACSGPECALLFFLTWNCSEIPLLPVGPFTSRNARSRLVLCLETSRPASPPCPLMLRCGFGDHGAVATVMEQGTLVTFVVRDCGNVAFVASDHCHMASIVR